MSWLDAQFYECLPEIREAAKKYHNVLKRYNVSLREAKMIWFCTAYINMSKSKWFYEMIVDMYGCSLKEAKLILEGCNWGKPGTPSAFRFG